jgi:para-aminobenzoate synthetase/4-amino-4-deoxychorismate lyase
VILATTPIDSSNRLLFHKTTNREFYAAQAGTHADFDDVVFWNERGEVTESSVANVVVKLDDKLYTPPISSGLLAGTFRDEMIAKGMISERVITVEQLKSAQEFFLINSVRRWMTATLNNAAVAQTF